MGITTRPPSPQLLTRPLSGSTLTSPPARMTMGLKRKRSKAPLDRFCKRWLRVVVLMVVVVPVDRLVVVHVLLKMVADVALLLQLQKPLMRTIPTLRKLINVLTS